VELLAQQVRSMSCVCCTAIYSVYLLAQQLLAGSCEELLAQHVLAVDSEPGAGSSSSRFAGQ
jgi:hypothetical protein